MACSHTTHQWKDVTIDLFPGNVCQCTATLPYTSYSPDSQRFSRIELIDARRHHGAGVNVIHRDLDDRNIDSLLLLVTVFVDARAAHDRLRSDLGQETYIPRNEIYTVCGPGEAQENPGPVIEWKYPN